MTTPFHPTDVDPTATQVATNGTRPAVRPPDPPARPSGTTGDGARRPGRAHAHSRVEQVLTYIALTVMALADAYGFWNTLTRLIQRDTELVLFFVVALAAGSVAAAHQLGRMVRLRREAHGGSISWMALLGLLWLGLGLTIAGIRAFDRGAVATSTATGVLSAAKTSGTGSIPLAILLLVVYLLTGALAMTHAYRFGDPVDIEVQELRRLRRRQAAEVARLAHDTRLAEGRLLVNRRDRERERGQHGREQDLTAAWTTELGTEARHTTALHTANAASTDALAESLPTSPETPLTPDPQENQDR